jgi:hypothetical protein
VKRIAELTKGEVDEYQLAGEEPLLHPECYKFPYIIKRYLPHTRVIIVTNGTLFDGVDEKFYKSCLDDDVQIWVTIYPVNIDYDGIVKNLRSKGLDVVIGNYSNTEKELKEMWGVSFHIAGGLDGDKNFEGCPARYFILRKGYLYICVQGVFSDLFNRYFETKLPMPKEYGINIHEVESLVKIMDYVSKKVSFCEYCNTLERMEPILWAVSERKMEEWTDMNKWKNSGGNSSRLIVFEKNFGGMVA